MSWDDLVTTALLGTARRPFDDTLLPGSLRPLVPAGQDPARLLDAAALLAVARRVRDPLGDPVAAPEPAAPDRAPVTGPVATAVLADLLRTKDSPLLLEFLDVAARAGRVVAPEALPALLDVGATNRAVADAAAGVLGNRGRWLAAQREDWRPQAARVATGDGGWEFGSTRDRVDLLRALRREDPAASRDLLRGSWSGFTGEEREQFVAELAVGLGPEDEDLLEPALADRRRATRDRAAALLARLPASAFAHRTAQRAQACVQHGPAGFHVEPPAGLDEAARRDVVEAGVAPGVEPRSEGVRAHWLRQVVAATPLGHWTALVAGSAADVLAVPVDGGWAPVLREAWAEAAVRQADPAWARALVPTASEHVRAELLAVLDPATRARLVADLLVRGTPDAAAATALLRDCPAPWTPELGTAALADTVRRSWPASAGVRVRERLDLLGHRLPPAQSAALEAFALQPALTDAARAFAVRALEVLTVRREFHHALSLPLEAP
ncbi:DUF5691 domain-containing protein [Kineococcus rhizosphaerae]|uniref:Uncharacterized protein n=1 Tax=Kineococcus rhizosphaerae TaxID=559628 RepID=A0A2T0R4Y3_9ACTN|nr:DUF5691 domain-containing protein [Kineococcus rhizosphaerae]PRY15819.1 hypothetical protein CLV37_10428 [Kineococcus rhizosphaerae]